MSIFADKAASVWGNNLPQDVLSGYIQDNRKYVTPTHECLRTILTKNLPHQLVWLKLWMKCGGVLDELWISPTSTSTNIHVLSILEIVHELQLNDSTLEFFSAVRSVFECLWLRHSKEIAKNVLSSMDPKLREAFLLAKFEGPSGEAAPLVYHAIKCNRTQLAQFFLLSNHGNDDKIFNLVISKNKSHWIAWFLRNELSNKSLAVDYLVLKGAIGELRKLGPKSGEAWLKQLHASIKTAVDTDNAECLEWLLENGADPNCDSLVNCSSELLSVFLKYGADPNLFPLDCYDKPSWKILLEHGARAVLKDHFIEDWVIVIDKVYNKEPFKMTPEYKERLEMLFKNLSNVLGMCQTTQTLYNNIENIVFPKIEDPSGQKQDTQ